MIVYIETIDGYCLLYVPSFGRVVGSSCPSPAEALKRRTVEKVLCEEFQNLGKEYIVVMNSEAPYALKNQLQDCQGEYVFYHIPSTLEKFDRFLDYHCFPLLFMVQ